jgi:hypothetical protein
VGDNCVSYKQRSETARPTHGTGRLLPGSLRADDQSISNKAFRRLLELRGRVGPLRIVPSFAKIANVVVAGYAIETCC